MKWLKNRVDSHHLGGGGTGTTGIRTRVHSQPAINVNILK